MKRVFPTSEVRTRMTPRSRRRGLSILEVLVSIGILVLGLLGVVALIPIAAQHLNKGIALDNATAVARAGVADFQARGANNLQMWTRYQPGAFAAPPANGGGTLTNLWGVQITNPLYPNAAPHDSFVNPSWSFCIDPLMYETTRIDDGIGRDACFFPYQPQAPSPAPAVLPSVAQVQAGMPSLTTFGRMMRVSVNWAAIDWRGRSTFWSQNVGQASSMCVSTDDLLLSTPGQEPSDGTFALTVAETDRAASQFDITPAGAGSNEWDTLPVASRIKRGFGGNISWFATMVPLPGSVAGGSRYYTLSVAVVDKRDVAVQASRATTSIADPNDDVNQDVESERTCGLRFVGGGLGGGEVELVSYIVPSNAVNKILAQKSLSRLREGNWIMVSGPIPGAGPLTTGHTFYWYRIGTIDPQADLNPTNPNEVVRKATLRGPDWPVGVVYANGMNEATLVTNVINVFEQTIELRGE